MERIPNGEPAENVERANSVFHKKARIEKPAAYPERFPVPDSKVGWSETYPEYRPAYFVAPRVLEQDVTKNPEGWADPEDINMARKRREPSSYEGAPAFDSKGRPLNPRGRTGIEGRGILGKWGANFAADPIVTRINPETGKLEALLIQRKDNKQWAIPGGMVDEGEAVSETLSREFEEEAGVKLDMSDAAEIYKGYVDDPRNTDNAWMETTVTHKHLSPELAARINPVAGDDAEAVRWVTMGKEDVKNLYASHGEFITKALRTFFENDLSPDLKRQIESALD